MDPHRREGRRRQAGRDGAGYGHPLCSQVEEGGGGDGKHHDDERSRPPRCEPPEQDHEGDRHPCDRDRRTLDLAEIAQRAGNQLKKGVAGDLVSQHFAHLAGTNHESRPGHIAREHRRRQEVHDEPGAQQPRDHTDATHQEREHRRQRQGLRRASARQRSDHGGREHGDGGRRTHRELARASEQRVAQQRHEAGVEPRHGWEPGELRVGHRLGHQQRGHGDSGGEVTDEKLRIPASEHGNDRQCPRRAPMWHGEGLPYVSRRLLDSQLPVPYRSDQCFMPYGTGSRERCIRPGTSVAVC